MLWPRLPADLDKECAAMPEMKSGKGQYFRGDEVPSVLKAQLEPQPIKAQ